jgi:hypothetical protein
MEHQHGDESASNEPEKDEAEERLGQTRPGSQVPDTTVEDDGSVPEKQIQRWKDEGGSWHHVG